MAAAPTGRGRPGRVTRPTPGPPAMRVKSSSSGGRGCAGQLRSTTLAVISAPEVASGSSPPSLSMEACAALNTPRSSGPGARFSLKCASSSGSGFSSSSGARPAAQCATDSTRQSLAQRPEKASSPPAGMKGGKGTCTLWGAWPVRSRIRAARAAPAAAVPVVKPSRRGGVATRLTSRRQAARPAPAPPGKPGRPQRPELPRPR